MAKYIFIAGGVMSGIGKGVAAASIGKILKSKGFSVTAVKIDPYINLDAGTMNPIEHGEVFVTDDGVECDQDIGNYERFLDENLDSTNCITTGSVYKTVIDKERNLEYEGKCVEVVPHIPEEVIERIKKAEKKYKADFVIIEVGGTVGEYQNMLFLEAARMLKIKKPTDVFFILVSYLPVPRMIGEMKTKPTQSAVRTLNSVGIQPDMLLGRGVTSLDEPRKEKLSIFCNINKNDIISAPDVKSIYEIPLNLEKEKIGNRILEKFSMKSKKNDLKNWRKFVESTKNTKKTVKIGMVGKYFKTGGFALMDSYISIIEAVKHASSLFSAKPEIIWIDSEKYKKNPQELKKLKKLNGVIVPGCFGARGSEGKIKAIEYCREQKIPFLGICLGMQLSVIEFSRNVCKIKDANTTEIVQNCQNPVIDFIDEQKNLIKNNKYGGTMRLGSYPCTLIKNSIVEKIYKKRNISERHRHRYEFNNNYREILEKNGMKISGINTDKDLVEIVEIKNHPFFIGVQFHPEFKSRPLKPHPLFKELIRKAIQR